MSSEPGTGSFEEPPQEIAAPSDFPWPPPPGTSSIDALVRTGIAVLTRPARFFSALPLDAPVAPAAVFLVIATYAGAGVNLFWEMILPDAPWMPAQMRTTGMEAVVNFLLAGPVALAMTTLVALLVHAGLIAFAARRERARSTAAVLYYASATAILQIVPWIGALLAGLASIVITIIGVREVHGTSTGRAAAAVLLPILAVAALIVFSVMLLAVVGLTAGILTR